MFDFENLVSALKNDCNCDIPDQSENQRHTQKKIHFQPELLHPGYFAVVFWNLERDATIDWYLTKGDEKFHELSVQLAEKSQKIRKGNQIFSIH